MGTENDYLQPTDAPITDKGHVGSMFAKVNPYAPPVFVSKGTVESTLGGRTTFKDANGGTLLTYDPDTGTITIAGGILLSQALTLGTLNSSVLQGTNTNTGLLTGGTITGLLGGTLNSPMGTITAPTISGTPTMPIAAGSSRLSNDGNFALQIFGTAVNLVINAGGTTYRFNPTGTI